MTCRVGLLLALNQSRLAQTHLPRVSFARNTPNLQFSYVAKTSASCCDRKLL